MMHLCIRKKALEQIVLRKCLNNFINNYKETTSSIKLNVKFWTTKTEIVFSGKTFSKIYNFYILFYMEYIVMHMYSTFKHKQNVCGLQSFVLTKICAYLCD